MEETDTSVFIELKDLENYKKEAEENKVLRSQIEELKAELQQLNEHLRLHKGEQELHQSLVEENKKLVRTLQNSNEVLESKMAQLKQTIENLVKESKLKDETIQHQLENIFMFEKRVQTLEQSLEKTESQSQRHLEEKKALVARLDELSKHASDNQWENLSKSLIAENKHLKDRLASSDDEKKTLLEKIATKEKLIDSQNKTIAQISKEGQGNLSSLKEAIETINRLNIEVSKEKKQAAEYQIESQKLKAETKSLLEKIAQLDKKLKDLSTKVINKKIIK